MQRKGSLIDLVWKILAGCISGRNRLILGMYKGSTNQKTGDSMVRPEKKLKKILLLLGITGAVYGGFQYLLPLVIPFLLAYGTALWLRPSIRFFERRLKIRIGNREFRASGWVIGGLELLTAGMVLAGFLYLGGRLFFSQLGLLCSRLPDLLSQASSKLSGLLLILESRFGIQVGGLSGAIGDMARPLVSELTAGTMPTIMNNSVALLSGLVQWAVALFLYFAAVLLCIQEMETLRERKSRSLFYRELSLLGKRLLEVGSAWLKTQLILLLLISALCILGLFLIGNPYSVLLGLGIGLLDALPILGSGAVLIPWGLFLMAQKQWADGLILFSLSSVCYLVRRFLEARLMGNKVGLSALETLFSMYVGLKLFGVPGLLLGPLGLLLIEDLTTYYSRLFEA